MAVFLLAIGLGGGCFLLGRWHGYETSEKHYREAKDFVKELVDRGLL